MTAHPSPPRSLPRFPRSGASARSIIVALLLSACSTTTDPSSSASICPLGQGKIIVTTATTGVNVDGVYTARVGEVSSAVSDGSEADLGCVGAGQRTVELTDVASNCEVANNPRTVTLSNGDRAVVAFEVACSTTPTQLRVAGGDEQTGQVGTALTDELVVEVSDDDGRPVAAVSVAWQPASGATDPTVSLTDEAGLARTKWTLGPTAGRQALEARIEGLDNAPAQFTATGTPGPADEASVYSGDNQTGEVKKSLRDPLVVTIADQFGNGIPGIDVGWAVTAGDGQVSPDVSTTDASGMAETTVTLGTTEGTLTIEATASGLSPVTFLAQAIIPAPQGTLLYTADEGAITHLRQVQADGTGDGSLVPFAFGGSYSPDGSRIVYNDWGTGELFIADADGGNPLLLHASGFAAAWGPTDVIAFSDGGIWTINPDGSGLQQLTSGAAGAPAWGPGGSALVYPKIDPATFTSQLWILDVATLQERQLTAGPDDFSPDWRGSQIAFYRGQGGTAGFTDLYVVDAAGGTLPQIIPNSFGLVNPDWSSDGKWLAAQASGGGSLFLIRPDGLGLRTVPTSSGFSVLTPTWRP